MTILTGSEAQNLVQSMIDPKTQTQMCGMELTVQKIERFTSAGAVAFDNIERELPETEQMHFEPSGWIDLPVGVYLVTFNEIVNIPRDVAALARARSTLLRCGRALDCPLGPGLPGQEPEPAGGLQPTGTTAEEERATDATGIPATGKRGGEGVFREVSGREYLSQSQKKDAALELSVDLQGIDDLVSSIFVKI